MGFFEFLFDVATADDYYEDGTSRRSNIYGGYDYSDGRTSYTDMFGDEHRSDGTVVHHGWCGDTVYKDGEEVGREYKTSAGFIRK